LDAAFHNNVCHTDVDNSYRSRYDYSTDVAEFCKDYAADKLFDEIPGRHHSAFPTVSTTMTITDPAKLKARLVKYSRKLDAMHAMAGRFMS